RMTFRINLKEPSASFIHTLNQICVVSGKALKEHYNDAWLKTHAVGTGPYKIDDFQPNADKLTFTKFEDYWRGWEGKHVSRVESIVVPESATQRMMLEKGEADFMERYPIEYNFEIKDDHPNCSVLLFDTLRTSVLPLNTVTGPLTDIRLRKALMYAFPYEKFVDEYYRGMAEASVGPVPPKMLPDPNRKPFKQDLSKAKELLAEAGYAN
ncbi:MAG: ABC transporter substrate-binding protein, partial [Desulfitobacteriaceae bacterium]|nr:ABC transporter substrate-binding protein [Desulfitobacteriaceae bacterium]